jgi:hypothetical protein
MEIDGLLPIYRIDVFGDGSAQTACCFQAGSERGMASMRGFKTVSRWFPRPFHPRENEEDMNERNGLLTSHLDQVVPVADADEETKALALHVEPKVP